ncbi:hypothetical protein ACIBTV_30860 [Micromonospora sp. NPDC049366]|uniref:hypothetical protein n=1 Tax=Micromonospora sp. NPDC049366 TaxID=3364271 RepID=UPI0037984A11
MDVQLLLGRVDGVGGGHLDPLVLELAELFGVRFRDVTDGWPTFLANTEGFKVWVSHRPDDEEPWLSHPFLLDLATEKGREVEVGEQVYQKLVGTGRYRVALLLDGRCLRSSHVSWEDW